MEIGEQEETVIVEPKEDPHRKSVPDNPEPVKAPDKAPERVPEKV